MARTSRTRAPIDSDDLVRAAIEYADKHAGADDAAFVRALNLHFHLSFQKANRAPGVSSLAGAEQPDKSFHIYEDPRYLANARQLARRTVGGLRS